MKDQKHNGWTEADERLLKHLKRIIPDDKDTALLYGLVSGYAGLTEELVDYIEENNITDENDIHRWLFEEGRIDVGPTEVTDNDYEEDKG